jgi:hypothetical protein
MEILPFDIIINHIIPYTYNIQQKILLEDIKNYYVIKKKLMNNMYDTRLIKYEILAIFYNNKETLLNILNRYVINIVNINKIYDYSNNKIFSILFGLFTKEERIKFLNHIEEDNGIWFMS